MGEPTIQFETRGLTVGYRTPAGELRLFDRLDLRLHAGELVCLMGPNGSGKSTLIRTLAGLHPALSGEVPPRDEKNVAIVLTDRVQSQHMRVSDLVAFGRYPYLDWKLVLSEADRRKIADTVAVVRIGHLLERTLNELSDGQMQMVMIARALVQDTPVILLDEPTAHLDLNNRLEMMNLLRRLAREQRKAILLATHELDLALQTADQVWLVSDRKVVTGIPEDLVLDGTFDDVFRFKGYDLKTGKVEHESFRQQKVKLSGEGSVYLWTKNALERNGFEISDESPVEVHVNGKEWVVGGKHFATVGALVTYLIESGVSKASK